MAGRRGPGRDAGGVPVGPAVAAIAVRGRLTIPESDGGCHGLGLAIGDQVRDRPGVRRGPAFADFARAWALLGAQTQHAYGSLDEFSQYQSAVLRDAHGNIVVRPPTFGSSDLDEWWSDIEDPDVGRDRAGLVELFDPDLPDSPADWELYIVAPDGQVPWRMWMVR